MGVDKCEATFYMLGIGSRGKHDRGYGSGDLEGLWAVTVRANWRIVFRYQDGSATDVDLVDYH